MVGGGQRQELRLKKEEGLEGHGKEFRLDTE